MFAWQTLFSYHGEWAGQQPSSWDAASGRFRVPVFQPDTWSDCKLKDRNYNDKDGLAFGLRYTPREIF